MVFGIVRQSGGAIRVKSAPGAGSTFEFFLPALDAAPERVESGHDPSAESKGGNETLLLVEDEEMVREFAGEELMEGGYDVLTACDAEEAEARFLRHGKRVDLLVTDVVLPGRDGLSLYESLSRKQPGLRVLYVSGFTEQEMTQHGIGTGGAGFLEKPFDGDDLLREVRRVLDA
jgi:DNA-binding NtrC family response regulator